LSGGLVGAKIDLPMREPGITDHERLGRLIDVGRNLVSEFDLELVLRRVLDAARELTGAEYAAIGVLDPDRRELERFITVGIEDGTRAAIGDLPRGRGVLGVLVDEPIPLRLDDVGAHPRSYGFPVGHPPMRSFLGVPILLRGEPYGNLYLTEKHDGPFDEADEEAAVVLADWAAIAIANARSYSTLAERSRELEGAVATFQATAEIARAVAGETDLQRVLELIVKRGRALTDARAAMVLLEHGREFEIAAVAGDLSAELVGERSPWEGTVAGDVARTGKPERLADAHGRLRFVLSEHVDAQTALVVALLFRGRALGVLAVFDRLREGPAFTAWDEHLLGAFGASAASAVATAQDVAVGTLRRRLEAQEAERRRWARELHDGTLQELAALKILAAVARKAADATAREAALDEMGERVEVAVGALRGLITDLRPAALDEVGLPAALEALVRRVGDMLGLPVSLQVRLGDEYSITRFNPELEDMIYRVVQEALSNVAKHATAGHVEVAIVRGDGVVQVSIRDDGVGFDPDRDVGGFGLLGIRERVDLLDGTLAIESTPGSGTRMRISVPLEPASDGGGHRDLSDVA
jgi:signal transduction histidine kinase